MPNIHELVDNVAAKIANGSVGEVWFTNLDLKNAYSQLALDKLLAINAILVSWAVILRVITNF